MSAALDRATTDSRAAVVLRKALESGRVAHAYAFVGPESSGRTAVALAFAQALLCESGGCGTCRHCRMCEATQHPDLHVIVPTPPASNPKGARAIRIDAIRDLERQAALRPVMAARKVFVLDEADRMTGESPDAFLKTLEEPPDRTVIVLVLSRPRSVPATVLSRCQLVRFAARETDVPAGRGQAIDLLRQVREDGIGVLLVRGDRVERETAEATIDAWWLWCRDLLIAKTGSPAALMASGESPDVLAREAHRWTVDGILAAIEFIRRARTALAHNVTPRLTLEVVASRLASRAA